MHATFALVDALRRDGHAIAAGRGLHRPLVGRRDDGATEAYWRATIGPQLAFDWHATAPASLGLAEPAPSLWLRDAGWLDPRGLLDALDAGCDVTRIDGRVVDVDAGGARLADGTTIRARDVLWCGGAWGAALLDDAVERDLRDEAGPDVDRDVDRDADRDVDRGVDADGRYEPGALLHAAASPARAALTFGVYAVPWDGGTIVGPTRDDAGPRFVDRPPTDEAVRHLADRLARVHGVTIALTPAWHGVRLARLSSKATRALAGVATLTALGSRGFLAAPLLAAEWARSL